MRIIVTASQNVDYYRTILEQFHLRPEECLMVGNDVEEDLAIRKLGVKTFLVTDTKENKKDLPIESDYQGSMEELFAFVESLEKLLKNLFEIPNFYCKCMADVVNYSK